MGRAVPARGRRRRAASPSATARPTGRSCRWRSRRRCWPSAGVGAAFVSDWFVAALRPTIDQLRISEAFAGIVIVAIAGNAVENVAGIVLARKGESDLAICVVKNSVAQIAAFLFPVLVLISLLFTHHLTFALDPVYIGAMLCRRSRSGRSPATARRPRSRAGR